MWPQANVRFRRSFARPGGFRPLDDELPEFVSAGSGGLLDDAADEPDLLAKIGIKGTK